LPSALPTFHNTSLRDHYPESDHNEVPEFIKYVHYEFGENVVFNASGIGRLTTLVSNKNGDCLFAMHAVCANIVQGVCARQTTYPSLRAYYEVLISVIPHYYDETGIIWPHDYFGATEYWGYSEWDYHEGFQKFVTDPLEVTKTATYVLDVLHSAPTPRSTPAETTRTSRPAQDPINTTAAPSNILSSFERLPSELVEEISDFVPDQTVFAMRLTSRTLAYKLPWDQRLCYKRLVSGISMPHLWGVGSNTNKTLEEYLKGHMTNPEQQNWKYLTTLLADTRKIVGNDPEKSGMPLELWNRCRIWECVVDVKRYKRSAEERAKDFSYF
jgi:hypothetical protein